jgi:hypothetical protein
MSDSSVGKRFFGDKAEWKELGVNLLTILASLALPADER